MGNASPPVPVGVSPDVYQWVQGSNPEYGDGSIQQTTSWVPNPKANEFVPGKNNGSIREPNLKNKEIDNHTELMAHQEKIFNFGEEKEVEKRSLEMPLNRRFKADV